MLELDLEQPDDLDGQSGCARDTDQRVVVGSEHLLDVALRDEVARGRSPIAGHYNPALVHGGDDRGAVGHRVGRCTAREKVGRGSSQEVGERRRARRRRVPQNSRRGDGKRRSLTGPPLAPTRAQAWSLAALLDEGANEVLGVRLEDVIDLVEDRVDVLGQFLVSLGDIRRGVSLDLVDLVGLPLRAALTTVMGRHRGTPSFVLDLTLT